MIKKIFTFSAVATMLVSCHSLHETARTENITSNLTSATIADLEVYPERVDTTIMVDASLRRGGEENVKRAAEAAALRGNKRGDLLVEPQYVIKKQKGFFGSRITEISVTGRPASFKNFRSLDDSVWTDPVFRGIARPSFENKMQTPALSNRKKPATKEGEEEKEKIAWRQRGFKSIAEFGMGSSCSAGILATAFYTLGYQLNPHWYLGIGAGYTQSWREGVIWDADLSKFDNIAYYEYDMNLRTVPVFAHARWYVTHTKVTPYLGLKVGYAFACYNTITDVDERYHYVDAYDIHDNSKAFGGAFVQPSLGVAISTKKGRIFNLEFNYEPKMMRAHNGFGRFSDATHRLGGSIGVTF